MRLLMSSPTVVILPEIQLTHVCNEKVVDSTKIKFNDPHTKEPVFYHTKQNEDYHFKTFNYFPVVLLEDSSPWQHAVLYLMHKLEMLNTPRAKTLESIAKDLTKFRQFLDDEQLDYLVMPKRKFQRPTYRYRAYIQDCIRLGELAQSTASRLINSMVGFYRWLKLQDDVHFEYPLWVEQTFSISFRDAKGFSQSVSKQSTNLRVHVPKSRNDYTDRIDDGGKLRPLDKDEQEYIAKALKAIGNTEMSLAFLFALTTGARIQTIFTLRLSNFLINSVDSEVKIFVGQGTLVDTKYQKRQILYVPEWLYQKIKIYIHSERAKKRRAKNTHNFKDPNYQYVFLTSVGKPYYLSENDPAKAVYRNPPDGVNVRSFISQHLKPKIKELGGNFNFSFHDLRATYGMNLVEEKSKLIKDGDHTTTDILMFVRERMGHNQLKTTQHYLDYKKKFKLAMSIQSDFEKYLQKMIEDEIYE